MKKIVGFIYLFSLIGSPYATALKYKIEVCVVPLSNIVKNNLSKILLTEMAPFAQHMFVRTMVTTAEDKVKIRGLNFAPAVSSEFLDGTATLDFQNHRGATCKAIINTDNWREYKRPYDDIVKAFKEEVSHTRYSLFNQNCQVVTRRVLETCGFEVPDVIEDKLNEQPEQLIKEANNFVNVVSDALDGAGINLRGFRFF